MTIPIVPHLGAIELDNLSDTQLGQLLRQQSERNDYGAFENVKAIADEIGRRHAEREEARG